MTAMIEFAISITKQDDNASSTKQDDNASSVTVMKLILLNFNPWSPPVPKVYIFKKWLPTRVNFFYSFQSALAFFFPFSFSIELFYGGQSSNTKSPTIVCRYLYRTPPHEQVQQKAFSTKMYR